jgi:predicted alpha/beta hydrolase family esterase
MTTVYFFGGYRASQTDVSAWRTSLLQQKPGISAVATPYPQGASSSNPLAFWNNAELAATIARTNDDCFIVGHSSGCALANDLAERVLAAEFDDFTLIALDGFKPDSKLLARDRTICWSAQFGHVKSLNYAALQDAPRFEVYRPSQPAHNWALHFSLVNANARDGFVDSIPSGYRDCKANLCWSIETYQGF